MKFLKKYESISSIDTRYRYEAYKSDILNDIIKIPTSVSKKCQLYNSMFYVSEGILWILYKYRDKNRFELISNLNIYINSMSLAKDRLQENKNVTNVTVDYKGRFAPLAMGSHTGGQQKANESIFEVRCKLDTNIIPLIIDEIDMKNNAAKFNI